MGKASRDKGERGMLEVQHMLEPIWPKALKRSQYRGARTDGCDIEGTGYWEEVKRYQRVTWAMILGWMAEAKAETDGRRVRLWVRENHGPWECVFEVWEGHPVRMLAEHYLAGFRPKGGEG